MTPQGKQRCTRLTGCQKAECLTCNQSGTGTHHVRDLSQELGTTPPPKKLSKPPTPADHIISTLTEGSEQAFLDNKAENIKALLHHYDLFGPSTRTFSNLTMWLLRLRQPSQPPVFRVGLRTLRGKYLGSTNRD